MLDDVIAVFKTRHLHQGSRDATLWWAESHLRSLSVLVLTLLQLQLHILLPDVSEGTEMGLSCTFFMDLSSKSSLNNVPTLFHWYIGDISGIADGTAEEFQHFISSFCTFPCAVEYIWSTAHPDSTHSSLQTNISYRPTNFHIQISENISFFIHSYKDRRESRKRREGNIFFYIIKLVTDLQQ